MSAERQETVEEKRVVEAMVTAILKQDFPAQQATGRGLTPSEERLVRAGSSIIAGVFFALASSGRVGGGSLSPAELWRLHLEFTNHHRESRSANEGDPHA